MLPMYPFSPRRRRFLGSVMLPAAAWALAGCATQPGSDADRAALLRRVNEYWSLALKNERLKMWPYEAASLDGKMTIENYLKRGGMTYQSFELRGIHDLAGDTAQAELQVRYSVPLIRLKDQDTLVRDPWQRVDGVWYHAPGPGIAFPGN